MRLCHHCQRRLLSQASARCSWCGQVIDDTQYQAQASAEREAYFVHQAQHDAQSLASINAINFGIDSVGLNPAIPAVPAPKPARATAAAARSDREETIASDQSRTPEPKPQDRFQHLEW